jgi:hypothetical protein
MALRLNHLNKLKGTTAYRMRFIGEILMTII